MGVGKGLVGLCAAVFAATLLSACGSGSSSGSSNDSDNEAPPPSLPELTSVAPATMTFELQAGETGGGDVSFSNSGTAPLTYGLSSSAPWLTLPANASGSVAAGGTANLSVDVTCATLDLSGSLVLTTNDPDEASQTIPVTATCLVPSSDLEVTRVLMNQGARAFDSDTALTPTVEVLAGRELLVRVFVTGSGSPPEARVRVERPGQTAQTFAMQVPPSISASPASDTLLQASHHVVVPGSAIQAGATLRVELAPFSNPVSFPLSGAIDLGVVDAGAFEVTFVPVTFQGQTPTINGSTYIQQALQVLPIGDVDVDVRTPYTYTGAYDLEDLLMEIADLRNLDGSNRLYHGVIIPPSGSSSATAGVGYVGFPVSVSVDLGGAAYVIAHEMGHNLSLGHAPGCGSPNPDPDFPYANGEVTSWGYDVDRNALVNPAGKSDLMSYCSDVWISDYFFAQAIQHRDRSPIGFGPPAGKGLTISGRLQGGVWQEVRLLPTDRVVMSMGNENAEYSFVAWDRSGTEVVRQTFALHKVEDGSDVHDFALNIPRPGAAIDHFEIRRGPQLVYADRIDTPQAEAAEVSLAWQNERANIQWSARGKQALIVRDESGKVVAVDRSGQLTLKNAPSVSLALTQHGRLSEAVVARSDRNIRFALTR